MTPFPDHPVSIADLPRIHEIVGGLPPDQRAAPGPARNKAGETRDQARTRKNRQMLAAGVHPATRTALRPVNDDQPAETCGSCAHHHVQGGTKGRYHKCDLTTTRGPASDIRVGWPACNRWESDQDGAA